MVYSTSCYPQIKLKNIKIVDPITARKELIRTTLMSHIPVIKLEQNLDSTQSKIQTIFLNDPRMNEIFKDKNTNAPLLSEVFSITKMRPSDIPSDLVNDCNTCYRIELYNYALNTSFVGIVDSDRAQVKSVNYYRDIQPLIPPHLGDLALYIASQDPQVIAALGPDYDWRDARMSSTKTALNRTKCQRSLHLCLAPTFVKGEKALWTIVDLTDMKVAGIRWTEVGYTGNAINERLVQNKNVMECFCDKENKVSKNGWEFSYSLTRSDGLRVANIHYKNLALYKSVKTVDWHVSYSSTDGFGYSDAIGCPEFSQSAVIAIEAPVIYPIIENHDTIGFALSQKYFSEGWPTPCSYNYEQHFEFYNNGSFRPVVGSLGRGCGITATYRPVTRIALFGVNNKFYTYQNKNWHLWEKEQWIKENELSNYFEKNIFAKIERGDNQKELLIEANRGQFNDGSKSDQAYFYISKKHIDLDEGEADLPTIGPCCNIDYRQGPEKFIEPIPEALSNTEIVLWYVPELKNNNVKGAEYCWAESIIQNGVTVPKVYPCFSGPKFNLK